MNLTNERPAVADASGAIEIVLAGVEHLRPLSELMDAYRVFYGRESNRPAAEHFLFERIINHESVIYLALDATGGEATGFLQLYPTFSSVALQPVWILNDLYVRPEYRGRGVARKLVRAAMDLVCEREDWGLCLETAPDNAPARALYEKLGFCRDERFMHYFWQRH